MTYKLKPSTGKYKLCIVNTETGAVVGKYYESLRATAERHVKEWNNGQRVAGVGDGSRRRRAKV